MTILTVAADGALNVFADKSSMSHEDHALATLIIEGSDMRITKSRNFDMELARTWLTSLQTDL